MLDFFKKVLIFNSEKEIYISFDKSIVLEVCGNIMMTSFRIGLVTISIYKKDVFFMLSRNKNKL